jgi:hypothetical protein
LKLEPNESFVRAQVDVKKQVAIAIYLLGSSAEHRTIENLFGVSTSTVCKVVHMVCDAMGFPNCGGAIGDCYSPIKAPENKTLNKRVNRNVKCFKETTKQPKSGKQ